MQHQADGAVVEPFWEEEACVGIQTRGSSLHELRQPVHAKYRFVQRTRPQNIAIAL